MSFVTGLGVESHDVQIASVNRAMNSTGVSNVFDVSEAGILYWVGIVRSVAWTGTPIMNLEIQIDGGSTRLQNIVNGGTVYNVEQHPNLIGLADGETSFTSIIPLRQYIGARYSNALRVGLNVTQAGSAGTAVLIACRGKIA